MADIRATIMVEIEIDDEMLEQEYEGDVMAWANESLSVDSMDGRYLTYWIEEAY